MRSFAMPRLIPCLLWLAFLSPLQADTPSILYASHYNGTVSTLQLTGPAPGAANSYNLTVISTIQACGVKPSWLTLQGSPDTLFCSSENQPNGTLSAFTINQTDGSLQQAAQIDTLGGGVHNAVYPAMNQSLIAIAHYSDSSISTYALPLTKDSKPVQILSFGNSTDGFQEKSQPHQVLLDPSREFIIVPDNNTDMVHVLLINQETGILSECTPLQMALGSSPRHAVFTTNAKLMIENLPLASNPTVRNASDTTPSSARPPSSASAAVTGLPVFSASTVSPPPVPSLLSSAQSSSTTTTQGLEQASEMSVSSLAPKASTTATRRCPTDQEWYPDRGCANPAGNGPPEITRRRRAMTAAGWLERRNLPSDAPLANVSGSSNTTDQKHAFMYVMAESSNMIAGYHVVHTARQCPTFKWVGGAIPSFSGAREVFGAEIRAKDSFLYVSNRNQNLDPGIDSITTFTILPNGTVDQHHMIADSSHGRYPRTFEINKQGDLVAVGNQYNGTVAVISRNITTGRLERLVAQAIVGPSTEKPGEGLSSVVWKENVDET